jgi:hypothetical protein
MPRTTIPSPAPTVASKKLVGELVGNSKATDATGIHRIDDRPSTSEVADLQAVS